MLYRVHELFLYDTDLKGAKFSFGQLISHKNPRTNKPDMEVSGSYRKKTTPQIWFIMPIKVQQLLKQTYLPLKCFYILTRFHVSTYR